MTKIKPSIPKGTRDFAPDEVDKRNYIIEVIRTIYERYGFQAIETPALENLSTLTGKYGEEGDKLLFRVLNSGDYLKGIDPGDLANGNSKKLSSEISKRGLRYDLTVPLARFVVMHQNEISFPFKRYQIQPVWRADNPQKGRYREFFQCDADVIGTDSLLSEVDLVCIIRDVFYRLNLHPTIYINNKKILQGLTELMGFEDQFSTFLTILDKTDKIGIDEVKKQLQELASSEEQSKQIDRFFNLVSKFGPDSDMIDDRPAMFIKIQAIKQLLKGNENGEKGIKELEAIYKHLAIIDPEFNIYTNLDPTLARGLTYYTGTIMEVHLDVPVSIGSVCGGGRYDNLTGIFGLEGVSGVGISFGLDRIYDVMEALNMFPVGLTSKTTVMFTNGGQDAEKYALVGLQKVRLAGINGELYPENAKLKKQMKYANDKRIPFVVIADEEGVKEGVYTLKNMQTGDQSKIAIGELLQLLRQ